jgi:hypothetical protein
VIFVNADAATESSQGKGGTDHERVANLFGMFHRLWDSLGRVRLGNLFINFVEAIRKELTIFGVDDRWNLRTKNFDTIFFESSAFVPAAGPINDGSCVSSYLVKILEN